jgi:hypothetical protein
MEFSNRFFRSAVFKKALVITAIIAALLIIAFFTFRNTILHSVLEKKCISFQTKYNAELTVSDSYFSGFTGITLENISLVPNNNDTLFTCGKAYVHLKIFPLLLGSVSVDDVSIENTLVSVKRKQEKDNYSFLFRSEKEKSTKRPDKTDSYSEKLDRIFSGVFDKIPDNVEIHKFSLQAILDSNSFSISMPGFSIEDHEFLTAVSLIDNGKQSICFFKGEIHKGNKSLSFKIYAHSGQKVQLPYVKSKYGLRFDFDTLSAGFSVEGNNKLLDITGKASIDGLLIHHKKVAETDVTFQKLAFDFNIIAAETYMELDSSSSITYNRFVFNPYIRVSQIPKLKVNIRINNEFLAQDLFESLPTGLFNNFEGIRTKGNLRLFAYFDLDMQQPDSLKFDASLTGEDFSIVKYGVTDFRKINGTFSYTAYEQGAAVRTFDVGPENPDYTPLEEISPYLKDAVLISENGGYFYSTGFNVEAFRLSIIQNIREGRFVRGGSTIDMQLVKNVFLSHKKTIARKAEEILIAWLINNNSLCSKDKMYEVYLNIIEWGPGVYGISEASEYYFKKKPLKLSLAESIYLASIIPRPKWFKYSFDEKGELLPHNKSYFDVIAKKLVEKETASPLDTADLISKVKLKGMSKHYLAKDTSHFKIDSLMLQGDD